jgi:hypothetical protein
MTASTYGLIAEQILTAYYKTVKNDNSNYTLRQIAQYVAQEVAFFAKASAYEADKLGDSAFANDQFITSYTGLILQTDSNGNKYIPLPSIPAGMPENRDIAYIGFVGNSTLQVFPIRNKDLFMQQMSNTPSWMILCYIENNNIVFNNIPSNITANVNLKLVGSVGSGSELVNIAINIPKNYESQIIDKVLARLNSVRNVPVDQVNDNREK